MITSSLCVCMRVSHEETGRAQARLTLASENTHVRLGEFLRFPLF